MNPTKAICIGGDDLSKQNKVHFLENCYRQYEAKMYYIAYAVLKDVQQAEDAVQNVFLTIMKKEIYCEDVTSDDCKRYMMRAVKNAAIDQYRKNQREQEHMYLADDECFLIFEDPDWNRKDNDFQKESELDELLQSIPQKYANVIYYRVVEELSVKETADKLKISEANVRKRYERAKKLLQKQGKGGMKYGKRQYLYNG